MKHLFFPYDKKHYGDNCSILSWLSDKLSGQDEKEACKAAYDMADFIYDKRLIGKKNNDSDNELYTYVKGNLSVDGTVNRIDALKKLFNSVNDKFAVQELLENEEEKSLLALLYITKGNICLKISQCYYEDYSMKESEEWGHKANTFFWNAKCLADYLFYKEPEDTDRTDRKEAEFYLHLATLNLAKYYINYARKNRRSDYDIALDELKNVKNQIDGKWESSLKTGSYARQYALIWMEAVIDTVYIHRKQYKREKSHYESILLYYCLKSCELYTDDTDDKDELEDLLVKSQNIVDYEKMQIFPNTPEIGGDALIQQLNINSDGIFQKNGSSLFSSLVQGYFSKMELYDRQRYFLLVLISHSNILRAKHNIDSYILSILMASVADAWSILMDKRDKYIPEHNIDSLNVFSSTLRKLVKYLNGSQSISESIFEVIKKYLSTTNTSHQPSIGNKVLCDYLNVFEPSSNKTVSALIEYLNTNAELGNFESKCELLKWYCLCLERSEINEILQGKMSTAKEYIVSYEDEDKNIQNQYEEFLQGLILYKGKKYELAKTIFAELAKKNQYIRLGTMGVRTRYLLASCYMSVEKYSDAEKELIYLHNKLKSIEESRKTENYDKDLRVEIDLGYCYMQNGNYSEALKIYQACFSDGTTDEKITDSKLLSIKQEVLFRRYIMALNNYAACCIFTSYKDQHKLEDAKTILEFADKQCGKKHIDRERELLYGYYYVCKKNFDKAEDHFAKACGAKSGYIIDTSANNNEIGTLNRVQYISSYIIHLVSQWKRQKGCEDKDKVNKYNNKIERFLLGIPHGHSISLKAAIMLSQWLIDFKKLQKSEKDNKKQNLVSQLYRVFGSIEIYEERGAKVFNNLRQHEQFRLLTPEQRGEILSYLLDLYYPIKNVKEECCISLAEYTRMFGESNNDNRKSKFVHYTTTSVLKNLVPLVSDKTEPHLRITNIGYMNDIFEGQVFFECMKKSITSENCLEKTLIPKYFPQLNAKENKILPSSSNVYSVSFSVNNDTFSMWSVYAEKELGCNIDFGIDFFDIKGVSYNPLSLRDYVLSAYKDDDYPLYAIQYISSQFDSAQKCEGTPDSKQEQMSKTNAILFRRIKYLLLQIYTKWNDLDEMLENLHRENLHQMLVRRCDLSAIRAFAADRLNEVRFLFKSWDYEYEGEVRVIYTDTTTESQRKIDDTLAVPRVYVDMERPIEHIAVKLGSRIDEVTANQYATWLTNTGRVDEVELSQINRPNR